MRINQWLRAYAALLRSLNQLPRSDDTKRQQRPSQIRHQVAPIVEDERALLVEQLERLLPDAREEDRAQVEPGPRPQAGKRRQGQHAQCAEQRRMAQGVLARRGEHPAQRRPERRPDLAEPAEWKQYQRKRDEHWRNLREYSSARA